MTQRAIKVKAMGLFVSPDGRFLASSHRDSVKGQAYLRLLGGGVAFGERSDAALRREMLEEIEAEITDVTLLEVVENSFTYEGRPGHEIVFVYGAAFSDPAFYTREQIPVVESDSRHMASWTPCDAVLDGRALLYPPANYAAHFPNLAASAKK